jgi:cytochrome oxidase Cu insertion factor (SCO1/SenC/PrrC family)
VAYQKVVDNRPANPHQAALIGGATPQPIVVNPLADKANVNYDIDHENIMMVVDPKGRVRVIYFEADAVSKWQLLHQVDAILHIAG